MDKILQKIIEIRMAKGYSQDVMASMMDISQSAYYKIEKGVTELTLKRVIQISTLLEISIEELLGIEINRDIHSETRKTLDILKQYDEHIKSLKEEIAFLKSIIERIKA